MILQVLSKLYADLLSRGEIARPGWSESKVGFALCIDENGALYDIVPLFSEVSDSQGKLKRFDFQWMQLPSPFKRSSGIRPNFLCDNAKYLLGLDKGKDEPFAEWKSDRFNASKVFHNNVLSLAQSEAASAVLNFFARWKPEKFDEEPVAGLKDALNRGANLVFRVNGAYAHEDPAIIDAWQSYCASSEENVVPIRCLVTGKEDVLAKVHPALKGVVGAQSSGAALVSFNADAFCSYNREQGENAPVGKQAAFAYTSALNYLLTKREHVQRIGETTIVFWADGAEPQYNTFSNCFLFGQDPPEEIDQKTLSSAMKKLASLQPCEELDLSPDREFYILGISPNAARLSVRFFLRGSFGKMMKYVNEHYERMRIDGSRYEYIPLWALLYETVNPKSKDKAASPVLGGAVARAIFSGQRYPAALLEAVMIRIRAERNITAGKAAIIKAYYLKNEDVLCPKEVLTVSLNENSTSIPYTIGRLFAWYEAAQETANPGINATIRDKYFNSVAANPASILPILGKLYQHHLKKMDPGMRIYYEKQVGALMGNLGEDIPSRFSLPEQGAFQLGYYHQKQKRFEKKES